MAFDEELKPLHELTIEGKLQYEKMLEQVADEMLFKHQHPIKWIARKAKEIIAGEYA